MARTHLSTIQRRDQTAAIEVWEEEDGSIVEYIDGNPSVTAKVNPVTGGLDILALGESLNDRIALMKKRSNILGQKLSGLTSVSPQTSVYTYFEKVAADTDFYAVQVVYYHHQATTPTIVGLVAATETSLIDTPDHIFEPIAGGTKYQVKDSVSDQFGWRTVTWAGSSSVTLPAGAATVPSITLSDWIPLSSVPRAAGELSSNPLAMLRLYAANAATQATSITTVNAAGRTETALNQGKIIQSGAFLGDGVGTLTDGNRPGSLGTTCQAFGLRFRTRKNSILVMGGGDSITQNNVMASDVVSCWGLKGCALASTSEKPISWWNNGQSAQASSVYQPNLLAAAAVIKPNVIVYSAYSPNDYTSPTVGQMRYALQNMMARTQEVIDYCDQNRIGLVLTTGLPHSVGLSAATDALRIAYNTAIKSMQTGQMVRVADFDTALTNNASPAAIAAAYNYGDNIHPNEAGIAVMSVVFANALKAVM